MNIEIAFIKKIFWIFLTSPEKFKIIRRNMSDMENFALTIISINDI